MRDLHGGRTRPPGGLPEPLGRHRPGPRRRRHRAGRQPRGGRRPHRRVPRPRHRRVHPLRLPPPRGGLPSRRGPPPSPPHPRPDQPPPSPPSPSVDGPKTALYRAVFGPSTRPVVARRPRYRRRPSRPNGPGRPWPWPRRPGVRRVVDEDPWNVTLRSSLPDPGRALRCCPPIEGQTAKGTLQTSRRAPKGLTTYTFVSVHRAPSTVRCARKGGVRTEPARSRNLPHVLSVSLAAAPKSPRTYLGRPRRPRTPAVATRPRARRRRRGSSRPSLSRPRIPRRRGRRRRCTTCRSGRSRRALRRR